MEIAVTFATIRANRLGQVADGQFFAVRREHLEAPVLE